MLSWIRRPPLVNVSYTSFSRWGFESDASQVDGPGDGGQQEQQQQDEEMEEEEEDVDYVNQFNARRRPVRGRGEKTIFLCFLLVICIVL